MTDPITVLSRIKANGAWLVGGAVRDRLLGRPTADYDVAVQEEPRTLARELARSTHAHAFGLSEGFGVWRVVARDHTWQVDVLPVGGGSIEADLGKRDLTINAIAEPLSGEGYVDPFGGLRDLRARRLRMVSREAFTEDPLRALRLARLGCELGFDVEAETAAVAAANAPRLRDVAPERIFGELKRILATDRAVEGVELMDALQATGAVLPELAELRGVQQSPYHHLDVREHTLAVLAATIELEGAPERWLGRHAEAIHAFLAEPLANELTRGQALRFGALFHDIAKPQTRDVTTEGRITFIGHDRTGAEMARSALSRLRASERLCEYVAALARHHLRLGFLVHEMPLTRRAVYRYLRVTDPVQVDVTLLSVADRLATRGKGSEKAIARHVELADQLVGEALAWRAEPPRAPIRGDELAREIGLRPGPEIGRLLDELEEASFAGEIQSRDQAVEHARDVLRAAAPDR